MSQRSTGSSDCEFASGPSDRKREGALAIPTEQLAQPLVVSVAVARRLLDVSNAHFYTKVLPELESYHEGRTRRITLASIKRYIERRLAENPANPQRPRRGRPRKVPLQSVAGVTGQPEATTLMLPEKASGLGPHRAAISREQQ